MNLLTRIFRGSHQDAAIGRADEAGSGGHELGYYFHPRRYPHAPGHPLLDVILRPAPTGRHFDPQEIHLKAVSKHRGVEKLTIRHPWRPANPYRVVAGTVSVRDRTDKVVEAFTFGGDLQVTSDAEGTHCVLTSSAPIIEYLSDPNTHGPTVTGMLLEELEALIARWHASWDHEHHPDEFDERLAATDPLTLYAACLQALREQVEHVPHKAEDDLTRQFVRFLPAEIESLHEMGLWPSYVPPLGELFSTP
jgi:hypothetical protein